MTHTLASYLTANWVKVGNKWQFLRFFFTGVIFGVKWRPKGHVTYGSVLHLLVADIHRFILVKILPKSDNPSSSYSNGSPA